MYVQNPNSLNDIFQAFQLGELLEHETDKLHYLYRLCVMQPTDLESFRRGSMIGQAILTELQNRQNKILGKQIEALALTTKEQLGQITALTDAGKAQLGQVEAMTTAAKAQLAQITTLTTLSQNQLDTSNAIVAEAKATTAEAKSTTFLSTVIASLTIVLALETYYLDIPEIQKMTLFEKVFPVAGILVLFGIIQLKIWWTGRKS